MTTPPDTTPTLRGDETALYATHHRRLFAAVRATVYGPDALVEDACQSAWLQLLRHQPDRSTAFGWLRTVAIRQAWRLSYLDRRESGLPNNHDVAGGDTVDAAHRARTALRALASLPPKQRDYLTLQAAGHSYQQIAALRHTTYTNVNKHLARARTTIRRHAP